MKTRSAEETKTETISFKVTANQKKTLKEDAKKAGKDPSKYICEKVFHAECIKPETMILVQDIINLSTEIAMAHAPEKIKEISRLEKKIWSSWT